MWLYPAAFLMPRDVVADDRIGGYIIPARSWVLLSAYATHRRPDIWPNPQGFDPDRIAPEAVAERSPYAFFPFFAGPHKCIGRALAMMEMKVLVFVIAQRCRLDLLPGLEPTLDAQVTLRVGGGLIVNPSWRSWPARLGREGPRSGLLSVLVTSDLELLAAWRAGDRTAGSVLFDRYLSAMVSFFASKRCADVEDLVQATFLACVTTRDRFRGDCSFRTYLFAVARRQLYKYFRSHRRHGADIDFGVTSLADLATGPSGRAARNQEHQLLLEALCGLPLEQQLLLEMYYWEDMDLGDLAVMFEVEPVTVRTRLFRARRALRERLARPDAPAAAVGEAADDFDAWARSLRDEAAGD